MREAAALADHELLEGVLGVERVCRRRPDCLRVARGLAVRRRPLRIDDLDYRAGGVSAGGGIAQERQVAVAHPAADVVGRPHEERVAVDADEIERREADSITPN